MTDTINPETGEAMHGRSPRFTLWVANMVFAIITLASDVKADHDKHGASIGCAAATVIISFFVVLAHLFPVGATLIVGTKIEGFIIIAMAVFWAVIVSIVTAEDIDIGNLYYFSWAGFISVILLLVNYLRHAFGVDVVGEAQNRSSRLTLWGGMFAAAVIVTGSSARLNEDNCEEDGALCSRTLFAISVGSISLAFAFIIIAMKLFTSTAPFGIEFAFTIILLILNGFGVAFITSPKGPGAAIGNLYYFSWLSCLCSAFLVADCFNQYSGGAGGGDSSGMNGNGNTEDKRNGGDIEVETFDDQI